MTREVLICDPVASISQYLSDRFAQIGWDIHATADEAEAGYRLLMWRDPSELPSLAILRLPQMGELLSFCSILCEEQVLEELPVIVLLDGSESKQAFSDLGVTTVHNVADPWPEVRAALVELRLAPASNQRVDQQEPPPPKGKKGARNKQSAKKGSSTSRRRPR